MGISCELLSNCTFALVFNSFAVVIQLRAAVVNCFQIVLSHWSSTASRWSKTVGRWLWIAFKLYFRIGLQQHQLRTRRIGWSCELLSNCTFALVFNSYFQVVNPVRRVVNCFQIVLSHWSSTANSTLLSPHDQLWIAFKLYFRIGLQQPVGMVHGADRGCELLSNCTFALVFNSKEWIEYLHTAVVNCFQIVLSHWSSTALAGEF